MEPESFVTLSAGGMPPAFSLPSPESSATESSSERDSSPESLQSGKESPISDDSSLFGDQPLLSATHDTSRTKYHMRDLKTFASHLEQAAASIFPNKGQSRYQTVRALLLRWEEDSLGVQYELDDLAKTFQSYGFETETWLIPTVKSHFALMQKALEVVGEYGKADSLLIIYYAGHGRMNPSRQAEWTCTVDNKPISLQWHAIQTLFEQADSDVLLLLDCCAAASGVLTSTENTNVTETIAACGFETWAPQPGRHSFTNTLIAVLEEWQDRVAFTAAMLHCEILNRLRHEKPEQYRRTKKFEYRKSPIHVLSTSDPKARSVELACRRRETATDQSLPQQIIRGRGVVYSRLGTAPDDSDQRSSMNHAVQDPYDVDNLTRVLDNSDLSIPHVLISLALEEEQLLDVRQCKKWLQDFPALAKLVTVQGVYRSNSTLLLLSIPVSIWDMLPSDSACHFVGYVHSQNLLGAPRSLSHVYNIQRHLINMLGFLKCVTSIRISITVLRRDRPKWYFLFIWLFMGLISIPVFCPLVSIITLHQFKRLDIEPARPIQPFHLLGDHFVAQERSISPEFGFYTGSVDQLCINCIEEGGDLTSCYFSCYYFLKMVDAVVNQHLKSIEERWYILNQEDPQGLNGNLESAEEKGLVGWREYGSLDDFEEQLQDFWLTLREAHESIKAMADDFFPWESRTLNRNLWDYTLSRALVFPLKRGDILSTRLSA